MRDLPSGSVTFLFTDIESSTQLLSRLGDRFADALAEHQRLLRGAFVAHAGTEVSTEGDAFFVVFRAPLDAVTAAAAGQRALAAHPWPPDARIRVRMGLHTGGAARVGDDYVGIDVNRAARIAGAGHGGQVLLSEATANLVTDSVPPEVRLHDLGRHRLKDIGTERLWQLDIEGLPTEFERLRSLEAHPSNLPVQTAQPVDRVEERRALIEMLGTSRIVTVTGAGGIGKSTLALAVAHDLLPAFPDGVAFADLAAIDDLDVLGSHLAAALGLRLDPGEAAGTQLLRRLEDRVLLVVLDTADRLVGLPAFVSTLAARAPHARVLVTSRAPLRIGGEQEAPLGPLDASAAEELFLRRARAVRPDLVLSESDAQAVGEICSRLDGLPLAIELAAPRVRLLPPRAIADRLAHRLPVLASGASDAPQRQRTLTDTIAWSYESLTIHEQRLLRRLGVFAGSFGLAAVEAVAMTGDGDAEADLPGVDADAFDALERLVQVSLVLRVADGADGRFRLLNVIREFCQDRLGELGEIQGARLAHATHFLAVAAEAATLAEGPDPLAQVERLRPDEVELRAALEWSTSEGDRAGLALDLASQLGRYWYRRGAAREGSAWLERTLVAAADAPDETRARALFWAGVLLDERRETTAAMERLEESLELQRRMGDARAVARTLNSMGIVAMHQQDLGHARELLRESLARKRELGDLAGVAATLTNLGVEAFEDGRASEARGLFEEALEADLAAGAATPDPATVMNLGAAMLRTGDVAEGMAAIRDALRVFAGLDDGPTVAEALVLLAEASEMIGADAGRIVRLAVAAEAIVDREGLPRDVLPRLDQVLAAAETRLDADALEQARVEGRAMDVPGAAAYALADGAVDSVG